MTIPTETAPQTDPWLRTGTSLTSLLQRPELAERLTRAQDIVSRRIVRQNDDGTWTVESQTEPGLLYEVNPDTWQCECEDWIFKGAPEQVCKHILACWMKTNALLPEGTYLRPCRRCPNSVVVTPENRRAVDFREFDWKAVCHACIEAARCQQCSKVWLDYPLQDGVCVHCRLAAKREAEAAERATRLAENRAVDAVLYPDRKRAPTRRQMVTQNRAKREREEAEIRLQR